jgi:ArsR family transcriptional regulator, zinc-responsive transcriptional repressor
MDHQCCRISVSLRAGDPPVTGLFSLEESMPSKSSDQSLFNLCQLFHLLSDKNRLRIVLILAEGEQDVTSLCEQLKLAQPTVSHHLGLLRMNRVIVPKRQGKRVIYSLDPAAGKVTGGKLKFSTPPYGVTIEGL